MSNWLASDESDSIFVRYTTFIIFSIAAISALTLFVVFQPMIESITNETPMVVHVMFIPTFIVGFLYGLKITERVMSPSESRSPLKRGIVKMFLFFFVIGGLFSSVNFALHGGSMMPTNLFDGDISMISVSLTQTDPTHSQVFLYTFFYAGIISGAFYEMNKLTTKQNMWDDYSNGYL